MVPPGPGGPPLDLVVPPGPGGSPLNCQQVVLFSVEDEDDPEMLAG